MSGVTDLKLASPGFTKDIIIQIFTLLDSDRDNKLRYADFCNLVSKASLEPEDTFLSDLDRLK